MRRESRQGLHFNRQHRGQIAHNGLPVIPGISRYVDLATRGTKVNATGIQLVDGHGIAQHIDVTVLLRQAVRQRLPVVSSAAAAVDTQSSLQGKMFRITLDRHDINGIRFMRMHIDNEAEIGGQIAADLLPRIPLVITAHYIPVLLHE